MKSKSKPFKIACLAILPLFLSACFRVQVIDHARNPQGYFDKAYRQIEKLERERPDRRGRAHELVLLMHEDSEDQIVRVSVPIWLVNFGMKVGMKAAEHEHRSNKWEDRYEFEWRALKDLGQLGPGLLVAIDDERDKILIWLE